MNDDRLQKLEAEIAELRREQQSLQQTVSALRGMLLKKFEKEALAEKRIAGRLAHIENATIENANSVKAIVQSRIWKILVWLGSLMIALVPKPRVKKGGGAAVLSEAERAEVIQVRCDGIGEDAKDPVAGIVEIKGWAIAPEGIESLEIKVGDYPLTVRYGTERPDIDNLFPNYSGAGKSGFAAGFDTRDVPDGAYRLKVKATSRNHKVRELDLPIHINQAIGFIAEYHRWIDAFESRDPELIKMQLQWLKFKPLVSVLVPVYKTNLDILRETVNSVKHQSYTNWELCLVDDGSDLPKLTAFLDKEAAAETRVRVITRKTGGGISAASNDALAMSTGEYVALLDHDDLLAKDALFHFVSAIQDEPRADLLYSDEDHIDESGRRFSPFFKPDWSPDLILGENYVTHLMFFRRDLAVGVGGFRSEFDLSQDHDILLRMSAKAQRIVHVPKILYHWRTSLTTMKRASTSEDKALASSKGVVESFTKGFATVEEGLYSGRWRMRYAVPAGTRISILIPTAGKTEVLARNLKSLWATAGYGNYEIVIIDNCKSKSDVIVKFTDELIQSGKPVRRFDQRGEPFNYSRLNNLAAASCTSELLLFLNDDTEGISKNWLLAMAELAMRKEVGAVGAKLLYPNGLIQHAGVTMGLAEICGHSFKGLEGKNRHYFDFPDLIRNVSAVTAACVMVRRDVFEEVNGFDEKAFPIAYNDIDLTLKIGAAGYRVLYQPHAQLYHHEAFSKSTEELTPHPAETLALKAKWKDVIEQDPFYNPNLTRHIENWSLRWD